MNEPLMLTGLQKEILMKGIVGAYPDPENLWILLSLRMEVQVSAIARGDAYNAKVFALIQDFEADGRIGEFIRVVVEKRPNSPFFAELKNEFATILGKDNTDEKNQQQPHKRNNGESKIGGQDGRFKGKDSQIKKILILASNPRKDLDLDEEIRLRYREEVKHYLSDHRLENFERDLLNLLRDDLGLSPEKANQILEEELAPIYKARQAYAIRLKALIKYYPFSDQVKSELKKFQAQWNLTDEEVDEISQPILEQAEIAYQEKLQPQLIVTPAPTSSILLSARGIDYSELAELLKQQKWKEADEITFKGMLEVANRSSAGWLRVEDIDNFPCEDLRTIDGLWVDNSKGRFGFSVQAKIYRELGGTQEYNEEVWKAFGDMVGWRSRGGSWIYYKDVTFDLKAPQGHLPGRTPPWDVYFYFGCE
jgi:hypothetical protein